MITIKHNIDLNGFPRMTCEFFLPTTLHRLSDIVRRKHAQKSRWVTEWLKFFVIFQKKNNLNGPLHFFFQTFCLFIWWYAGSHGCNFVVKCWGAAWCETNTLRNLKRKMWEDMHIIFPLSEKVGGRVPRVPHLIAHMPVRMKLLLEFQQPQRTPSYHFLNVFMLAHKSILLKFYLKFVQYNRYPKSVSSKHKNSCIWV